jgi:hypothetical protein
MSIASLQESWDNQAARVRLENKTGHRNWENFERQPRGKGIKK